MTAQIIERVAVFGLDDDGKIKGHALNGGGTALLGISRPVVKAHGSSNEVAFCNAIRQAAEVAQSGIIADIEANIDKMRISRED